MIYEAPEKLAQVQGISKNKANEISQEYREKREFFNILEYLKKYNLSIENVTHVYNEYGVNTVEIIKNNPYVILDIVARIGFSEIDNIALENGITLNNSERLEASIKYAMKIAEQNGHTYVKKDNLVDFVINLTGAEEENVLHAIAELSMKRYLNIEEERISLESLSIAELEIATKLELLKNAKIKKIKNVLDKITEIEKEENITLTTEQKTAIISALENNVSIITGGPRNR